MVKDMTIKAQVKADYLKYIVDNKYLLFADITKEQKTLIMKSMFRERIIKYIYFIADNNPRANEKITVTAIGINEIKDQFFETPIEIETLPYNWEYWQKLSEDAAIKIDQLNQQEKEQQEQLELKNNQTTMSENDYFRKLYQNGINACPPFYLIQRQGTIPRLAIHIEDWCKILEATGGDELVIKKLHELIDSNNSDTKKRAISNAIKKHKSEIASARRQTYLRKRCLNLYEEKYRFEIKNKISNRQNNISKLQKQNLHKSVKNNAESIYETLKCKELLNSQSKKTIGIWIKEYEIEKMIQENLIKKNKKDSFINNILTTANVLGFLSHIKKEKRLPKIERFFRSTQKK